MPWSPQAEGRRPVRTIRRLTRANLEHGPTRMHLYRHPATLYWSDDWSPGFYRLLARSGFINISLEHPELGALLIPEMQSRWAVLDWPNLHVSRTMRRWLRSPRCAEGAFQLRVGYDLDAILAAIQRAWQPETWLNDRYAQLVRELAAEGPVDDFEVVATGLVSARAGERLVAGEIGYRVGRIYSSLSGFFDRSDRAFANTGTLQLLLLAHHLEQSGYAFWNLGEPTMAYKRSLGARLLPRRVFLERWLSANTSA